MDERRSREIIESGIKSIGISLDAAREETFAKVRPPGGLKKIVENIKQLTRMKKEMGSPLPFLRLSFGVMPQNLDEIHEFPDLAADAGCDEIIVHPIIYMSRKKKEELFLAPATLREPVERARRRAEELGVKFYFWNLDTMTFLKALDYVKQEKEGQPIKGICAVETHQKPHFCFFLWRNAMIQGQGELFPCCYITNVHLGNLDKNDLLAWRGHPFLANMRRQLFEGDIPAPCARCPQLQPYDRAHLLKTGWIEIKNLIRG
jgi:MoaA/NifB/PqqE/SkfB family radical SAM enzyme